jgi:hypothetical protein
VQALDAERVEHDESLKTLAEARDQALKALSALPVEQPSPSPPDLGQEGRSSPP